MRKRGPKPYSPGSVRLMPMHIIAQRIGCSVRTVNYEFEIGMAKLALLLCAKLRAEERDGGAQ